jgi:MoaA/NifB/PqqE/SkfB family radical SAM enzyme
MNINNRVLQLQSDSKSFSPKLWIYTNYDCNLKCSYCVAESHPRAPKRAIQLDTVKKIVDEAVRLGFENIYFTGGEPFILNEIYSMLAYSAEKISTTVLTNAMLFKNQRLTKLAAIKNDRLTLQISLDGSQPEHHDPYRGQGTWQKTVAGIHKVLELGFRVRLSTTETPANSDFMDEICSFRTALGISDEDHFIRPLAKRGFSQEGMEVGKHNLIPEMTITANGVYWHPLSTEQDMLVRDEIFPLAEAIDQIKTELGELAETQTVEMEEFQ